MLKKTLTHVHNTMNKLVMAVTAGAHGSTLPLEGSHLAHIAQRHGRRCQMCRHPPPNLLHARVALLRLSNAKIILHGVASHSRRHAGTQDSHLVGHTSAPLRPQHRRLRDASMHLALTCLRRRASLQHANSDRRGIVTIVLTVGFMYSRCHPDWPCAIRRRMGDQWVTCTCSGQETSLTRGIALMPYRATVDAPPPAATDHKSRCLPR